MRDAGQHLGPLHQEAAHALLHPVERGRGLPHLGGALRPDRADIASHAERLGSRRQAPDRAHLIAHEQCGDAEQQHRHADDPEHEDVDRAGVEPLARRVDVQHAFRQLHADQHAAAVGRPVGDERHAEPLAQRAWRGRRPSGRGCWSAAHRAARRRARCVMSRSNSLAARAQDPGAIGCVRIPAQQLQRVGDLAHDGAGQPARDDVEMAAVEDLQRHRLQQHQRHQDHQQAAPEQRARQHLRMPRFMIRAGWISGGASHRSDRPGFST